MQFAVHAMPRGRRGFVVDVQADLLSDLRTRVVIPLLTPPDAPPVTIRALNPVCMVNGEAHILMTQNLATIPIAELGQPTGSLRAQRDDIVRALDALLSGL